MLNAVISPLQFNQIGGLIFGGTLSSYKVKLKNPADTNIVYFIFQKGVSMKKFMKLFFLLFFLENICFPLFAEQSNKVLQYSKKDEYLIYKGTKPRYKKLTFTLKLPLSTSDYFKLKREADEYFDSFNNPLAQALLNMANSVGVVDRRGEKIKDVLRLLRSGTGIEKFSLSIPLLKKISSLYSYNGQLYVSEIKGKLAKRKKKTKFELADLFMAKYGLFDDEELPLSLIDEFVHYTTNYFLIKNDASYKKTVYNKNFTTNTNIEFYDNHIILQKGQYRKIITADQKVISVAFSEKIPAILYLSDTGNLYYMPLKKENYPKFYIVKSDTSDLEYGNSYNADTSETLPILKQEEIFSYVTDVKAVFSHMIQSPNQILSYKTDTNAVFCRIIQAPDRPLRAGDKIILSNSQVKKKGKIIAIMDRTNASLYTKNILAYLPDELKEIIAYKPIEMTTVKEMKIIKLLIAEYPSLMHFTNKVNFWSTILKGDIDYYNNSFKSALNSYKTALQSNLFPELTKKRIKKMKNLMYKSYTFGLGAYYYQNSALNFEAKLSSLNNNFNMGLSYYVFTPKKLDALFLNFHFNYYPIKFIFLSCGFGVGLGVEKEELDLLGTLPLSLNLDLKYFILTTGVEATGILSTGTSYGLLSYFIGGNIKF